MVHRNHSVKFDFCKPFATMGRWLAGTILSISFLYTIFKWEGKGYATEKFLYMGSKFLIKLLRPPLNILSHALYASKGLRQQQNKQIKLITTTTIYTGYMPIYLKFWGSFVPDSVTGGSYNCTVGMSGGLTVQLFFCRLCTGQSNLAQFLFLAVIKYINLSI